MTQPRQLKKRWKAWRVGRGEKTKSVVPWGK